VRVPVSPNQMAAMVSLAYNIGLANFGASTLLRKVNAGDFSGAADQFIRWNRARGKVMAGLTRRRIAEASLFRGNTE
jgi:lysozyme